MNGAPLSVILLPTLECNVACDYCFEDKSKIKLSMQQLPVLTDRLLDFMAERGSTEAQIYWQGGEVIMLGPLWFEQAQDVMGKRAAARNLRFVHYMQTNLIGWGARWHNIVRTMFNNSIGTSMDFPNRHRRLKDGSTEKYTEVWLKAVHDAREAGIEVGVIAVLHGGSIEAGAKAFYEFFTETAGITDFQVNMPFPGGPAAVGLNGEGSAGRTLDPGPLSNFLVELMDVWLERGYEHKVKIGPFSELVKSFSGRRATLPCIWQENCAKEFISIDARGQAALCDCWVTSYPEHSFGNVFKSAGLSEMLGGSEARARFLERPEHLMEKEECGRCEWLSMCHGGCPVRTFTALGTIFAKDPYCEVYKVLFSEARKRTAQVVRRRMAVHA